MKNILIFIIIYAFTFTCLAQEKNNELKFDGIIKDIPCINKLNINGGLYNPKAIRIVDNLLIVRNYQAEYFISAYSLETGKIIFKCGKKGRGPGEILSTIDCNIDSKKKQIWLSDLNQKRISCYSYANVEDGIAPLCKSFLFNDEYIQRCILLGDSVLYCHLVGSKDGFSNILISRNGNLISRVGKYPKTNKEICYLIASNIFSCRLDCSMENKTIVKAYSKCKRIELLDLDGNMKKLLVDNEYALPNFYAEGTKLGLYDTSIKCFGDVVAGKDSFYVIYSGQNVLETFGTYTLLEFDYNGKCLHNYKLGKKIKSMDIDFSTSKIYGLGEDDDLEPCVYEFQL